MYYNVNEFRSSFNPKSKNPYQSNLKIFQSPSQQYQSLMYNNNNVNFINYNIKVNKIKNPPKEKIIEGDLNFNVKKIHHSKIPNNSKHKKNRNKPTKSPVPIPKDYKPSNFPYKRLSHNYYIQNPNMLKPKSALPRKNNFIVNQNNVNNINKNVINPNFLGNSNFPSNKTYNAFNIFKKNLERTHSPLLRTSGTNNGIHLAQKGALKQRHISKSPILSKGSIFNRYKMNLFRGDSNSTSSSSISHNQKIKKKTPNKNNQKKISGQTKQNINYNNYSINNLRNKGPMLISGEIVQDSSNNGKFNINNVNKVNNQNINHMSNHAGNKKINNYNDFNNLKPVYNHQNLKIESNNAGLNINAEPNKDRDNQKKNKDANEDENNINPNINKNVNNIQIISQKDNINNNLINNNQLNFPNNNKAHENKNKNEEHHKSNQRSLSQGIVDPLQKNTKDEEKESKERELQHNQAKMKKEKENQQKEKENQQKENKVIKKIIKEILPYTHVGFDGEEPKENNQDNYFIYKNFMNKKDYIYMSVCDGHGVEGHFVSDFIKETLPYDMSENLKNFNILTENPEEKEKIFQIIKETFIIANEKLVDNEEINSLFSGSTCVSLIYTPEKLIVPNIGDSRAVMGRLINKEKNEYKAIELSRDHKPTEKDEAQRIIENDGRIQPFT